MNQHDCISKINNLLIEHNTKLATAIDFSGQNKELIGLATSKLDTKSRKKPPAVFATHCPFCGVKLQGMS